MKPRITVITIGVDDLEVALRFYRDGLGFPTGGIVGEEFEHGAVVFIQLQHGLRLALWPRASIAHDTGLRAGPASPTELTLGHNVSSKLEVDAVLADDHRLLTDDLPCDLARGARFRAGTSGVCWRTRR